MPTIFKPKRPERNEGDAKERVRRSVYATARWRRLRAIKLQRTPLCERCTKAGLTVPAVDVHHKHSFLDVDEANLTQVAFDYSNLQSLCKQCHQHVHNAKES